MILNRSKRQVKFNVLSSSTRVAISIKQFFNVFQSWKLIFQIVKSLWYLFTFLSPLPIPLNHFKSDWKVIKNSFSIINEWLFTSAPLVVFIYVYLTFYKQRCFTIFIHLAEWLRKDWERDGNILTWNCDFYERYRISEIIIMFIWKRAGIVKCLFICWFQNILKLFHCIKVVLCEASHKT